MSKPPVTVVIPSYRRPAMLRRAICSVLNQDFQDFRLCIYDNASGDDTPTVADEFRRKDSRVEYVCRPSNIGMFANFVDGANRVETPFFSFLPDDDLLLPNFLGNAMAGFRQHPEAAMSALATIQMKPDGGILSMPLGKWQPGVTVPPRGMFQCLRFGDPGLPALLIRTEAMRQVNGFDEATHPAAELDFQLRVTARFPVFINKLPGAIQVMHSSSDTVGGGLDRIWPPLPRIIDKIVQNPDLSPAQRLEAADILHRWMKRLLVTRGILRAIGRSNWDEAQKAAEVLVEQSTGAASAQIARTVTAVLRQLPASSALVNVLVTLREWEQLMVGLGSQWRLRTYSKFLRDFTSGVNARRFDELPLAQEQFPGGNSPCGSSCNC